VETKRKKRKKDPVFSFRGPDENCKERFWSKRRLIEGLAGGKGYAEGTEPEK